MMKFAIVRCKYIYYRSSNLLIDLVDKGDSKIVDNALHEVDKARGYYVYLLLYY